LTENSKGNPYCAENFIGKKSITVHNSPKEGKKKQAISCKNRKKKSTIKLHKALEGQLFGLIHSNCLKMGFFDEANFPPLEGRFSPVEDEVISLFPN
jgi:hypothetical protein